MPSIILATKKPIMVYLILIWRDNFTFRNSINSPLEKVNITVQDISYDIPFDKQSAVEISEFLQKNQLEKYIAINFMVLQESKSKQ